MMGCSDNRQSKLAEIRFYSKDPYLPDLYGSMGFAAPKAVGGVDGGGSQSLGQAHTEYKLVDLLVQEYTFYKDCCGRFCIHISSS